MSVELHLTTQNNYGLPNEIWDHILSFLPPEVLGRISRVNTVFNGIAHELFMKQNFWKPYFFSNITSEIKKEMEKWCKKKNIQKFESFCESQEMNLTCGEKKLKYFKTIYKSQKALEAYVRNYSVLKYVFTYNIFTQKLTIPKSKVIVTAGSLAILLNYYCGKYPIRGDLSFLISICLFYDFESE